MTVLNLACVVDQHARSQPDALAIDCNGHTLSYAELARRAMAVGQALAALRQEDRPFRVGLLASRSAQACVALLGACWAGATYVPMNSKSSGQRITEMMERCELQALITDDQGLQVCMSSLSQPLSIPILHVGVSPPVAGFQAQHLHLPHEGEWCPPVEMAPNDAAYIIFTSGTTGTPKGVVISVQAARHYCQTIQSVLGLKPSDRALETCDLSFDFSVHNMFSVWEAGGSLHILPATSVMNAVKFVRAQQLTVWNSVPSLAGMLRQIKALAAESMPNLRITVFGGEQLPVGLVHAWHQAAPCSVIYNLFGPTEATVFCMAQKVDVALPPSARQVVAIGSPLPGNQAAIWGADGQWVRGQGQGELLIAGDQLALEYLGQPELTAQKFPTLDGRRWYRTGDLAMQDEQGLYHCLGRIDNQVKVKGYRIELEEIEAHLRSVSGSEVVASVAWPIDEHGMANGIVGFLTAEEIHLDALMAQLKQRMPSYMVPNKIIPLKNLPFNASGKVDRQALRQWLSQPSP